MAELTAGAADAPDFAAAAMYLEQARAAYAIGDEHRSRSARKMVAIALNMTDVPAPVFHTGHLKK